MQLEQRLLQHVLGERALADELNDEAEEARRDRGVERVEGAAIAVAVARHQLGLVAAAGAHRRIQANIAAKMPTGKSAAPPCATTT